MLRRLAIAAAWCAALLCTHAPAWASEERFVVYYADTAPAEAFSTFQLVILDSDNHPPLKSIRKNGKTTLGYVSLGEIEPSRPYFNAMREAGVLLTENKTWGSRMVDIRKEAWRNHVLERVVPHILNKGFDGVFLDTLDSPIEIERRYPTAYKGLRQASVTLVKTLRQRYPDIKIMMNRAYAILPQVAGDIDMVLGECVYSDYDFARKEYFTVAPELYRQQVQILHRAKELNPHLAVYTLDYVEKGDAAAIARIYRQQRKNGFIPYVATVALDEIVHEPGI